MSSLEQAIADGVYDHRPGKRLAARAYIEREQAMVKPNETRFLLPNYPPKETWLPTTNSGGCTWCGSWAIVDKDNLCEDCWEEDQ